MKNLLVIALAILFVYGCKEKATNSAEKNVPAEMAKNEIKEQSEWQILFDGTSTDQWQAYQGGDVPKFWSIEDGALIFTPPTAEERKNGGPNKYNSFNIVTKNEFTSFILSLEWKISEAGNSGIFWGIHEDEKFGEPYQTGLEIQVLDNDKHPDGKNGTSHQAGALYDLVSPTEDVTKPIGEWNTCVITVNHVNNIGNCVLNGVEVSSFPVGGDDLNAMLKESKFNGWEGFGQYETGKIGLQDHGDVVAYRNIKIKELSGGRE